VDAPEGPGSPLADGRKACGLRIRARRDEGPSPMSLPRRTRPSGAASWRTSGTTHLRGWVRYGDQAQETALDAQAQLETLAGELESSGHPPHAWLTRIIRLSCAGAVQDVAARHLRSRGQSPKIEWTGVPLRDSIAPRGVGRALLH